MRARIAPASREMSRAAAACVHQPSAGGQSASAASCRRSSDQGRKCGANGGRFDMEAVEACASFISCAVSVEEMRREVPKILGIDDA